MPWNPNNQPTNSFRGLVARQMRYNFESAKCLWLSLMIIVYKTSWNLLLQTILYAIKYI